VPVLGQIPSVSMRVQDTHGNRRIGTQRFEFAESFRSIRASLLFMNNGEAAPKTVVVSSSVPEEGKYTLALYLPPRWPGPARACFWLMVTCAGRACTWLLTCHTSGLAELLDRQVPRGCDSSHRRGESVAAPRRPNPDEIRGTSCKPRLGNSSWHRPNRNSTTFLVDTPPVMATDDATALALKADGSSLSCAPCPPLPASRAPP